MQKSVSEMHRTSKVHESGCTEIFFEKMHRYVFVISACEVRDFWMGNAIFLSKRSEYNVFDHDLGM